MPFILQRNGRSSHESLYRNAEKQLCVWNIEDEAEEYANRIGLGDVQWRVRPATSEDYRPCRVLQKYRHYLPNYVIMDGKYRKGKKVAKKTTSVACLVEIYEDYEARKVAISSKAVGEEEFISELADAMAKDFTGDWRVRLKEMIPLIVDMCCKYRGYKAETVMERRELVAGDLEMPRKA